MAEIVDGESELSVARMILPIFSSDVGATGRYSPLDAPYSDYHLRMR